MHLSVHGQSGYSAGGPAGLADIAGPPFSVSVRHKQRVSSAVVVLKRAVFIVGEVIFRPHVLHSTFEAEKAGSTVASRREKGASDAQQRLGAIKRNTTDEGN